MAHDGKRVRLGLDAETIEPLAGKHCDARLERIAGGRRQRRDHRPIFLRDEALDLGLAIADQAQRHRLHAARRARPGQLAPQHRRQVEADQIVERPPRPVGIDEVRFDGARGRHRVEHGLLGDGVEDDALHRLGLQRLLVAQHL